MPPPFEREASHPHDPFGHDRETRQPLFSVADIWKTGESKFDKRNSSLEDDEMDQVEDMGFVKKREEEKARFKSSKFSRIAAKVKEEGEVGWVRYRSFDYRKYLNSSSSMLKAYGEGYDKTGSSYNEIEEIVE